MEKIEVRCKNCSTKQTKEVLKPSDTRAYWHSIECDKCGSQGLLNLNQLIEVSEYD